MDDATDLDDRLALGLNKLGLAFKSAQWRAAEGRNLTPTQSQILAYLRARADRGDPRLSDVAATLGITAQTASTSINSLLAKGLVQKTAGQADKRAIALHLTSSGQRAAQDAADWPSAMLTAIAGLGAADRDTLLILVVKMIRALQIKGEIEPQRMCVTCTHFRPFAHGNGDKPHHCAFVDAAFGPNGLRIDCRDHVPAAATHAQSLWSDFLAGAQPP